MQGQCGSRDETPGRSFNPNSDRGVEAQPSSVAPAQGLTSWGPLWGPCAVPVNRPPWPSGVSRLQQNLQPRWLRGWIICNRRPWKDLMRSQLGASEKSVTSSHEGLGSRQNSPNKKENAALLFVFCYYSPCSSRYEHVIWMQRPPRGHSSPADSGVSRSPRRCSGPGWASGKAGKGASRSRRTLLCLIFPEVSSD